MSSWARLVKNTLWEDKVLQSISIILSKAVVVSDITGVVSAQTSSFIFTVQTPVVSQWQCTV